MKINQIFKLVLFTLISMCSFSTYSQNQNIDIKLKCKVKVERSFSNGFNEVKNAELIVDVRDYPKSKSILIKSSNEYANDIIVSTGPDPLPKGFEKSVSDRSDENTYEITNNNNYPGEVSKNTKIYLNRNNGEIIVLTEFKSSIGGSQTSIGGTCEKIDTTKKKF
jgi:hypothetical protein